MPGTAGTLSKFGIADMELFEPLRWPWDAEDVMLIGRTVPAKQDGDGMPMEKAHALTDVAGDADDGDRQRHRWYQSCLHIARRHSTRSQALQIVEAEDSPSAVLLLSRSPVEQNECGGLTPHLASSAWGAH